MIPVTWRSVCSSLSSKLRKKIHISFLLHTEINSFQPYHTGSSPHLVLKCLRSFPNTGTHQLMVMPLSKLTSKALQWHYNGNVMVLYLGTTRAATCTIAWVIDRMIQQWWPLCSGGHWLFLANFLQLMLGLPLHTSALHSFPKVAYFPNLLIHILY